MKGVVAYYVSDDYWVMESLGYYCCFLYVDIVCGKNEWMMQIMNWWSSRWAKKNIHVQIDSPLLKLLKKVGL